MVGLGKTAACWGGGNKLLKTVSLIDLIVIARLYGSAIFLRSLAISSPNRSNSSVEASSFCSLRSCSSNTSVMSLLLFLFGALFVAAGRLVLSVEVGLVFWVGVDLALVFGVFETGVDLILAVEEVEGVAGVGCIGVVGLSFVSVSGAAIFISTSTSSSSCVGATRFNALLDLVFVTTTLLVVL